MINSNTKDQPFDLEDRLIDFAVSIIKLIEHLNDSKAGKHIASQLLRSGTSPAPNYGEAQSAESKADFIHKLKIGLKELKETRVWLKIILKSKIYKSSYETLNIIIKETEELIAILSTCIKTAKSNMENEK